MLQAMAFSKPFTKTLTSYTFRFMYMKMVNSILQDRSVIIIIAVQDPDWESQKTKRVLLILS